jgi:hypothetical protein
MGRVGRILVNLVGTCIDWTIQSRLQQNAMSTHVQI